MTAPIKLPKSLRAEWMDVMALTPKVTPIAFKVAGVLGAHFSRNNAETFIKQETIARVTGLSERAVWNAIKLLVDLGYLTVERRERGVAQRKLKDGREIQVHLAGAPGAANVYHPAVDHSHVGATDRDQSLARRCDHFWEEQSHKTAQSLAPRCDPTLVLTLKEKSGLSESGSPSPTENPNWVWLRIADPDWDRWSDHCRRTGKKMPFHGRNGGAYFPSRSPPDHPNAADAAA
jgi:hypothetical protein